MTSSQFDPCSTSKILNFSLLRFNERSRSENHDVEKTLEQCCLGHPNSQRAREGVRWDKYSSSGLNDQQV